MTWHPFTQMGLQEEFLKVVRAKGSLLYLENGRTIIDAISSWFVTLHGHCEEEIAKAIQQQVETLEHVIFANFTHDSAERLVEELKKLLPSGLEHFFFSDNGSTAVEVALKQSFQYFYNTKKKEPKTFIAFEGGYHGDTVGAASVSSRGLFTKPFEPLFFDTTYLPFPEKDNSGEILQKLRTLLEARSHEIAALIIEPLLQGVGGMRMCQPSFLRHLQALLREFDVFLIFDEVLTGFGRLGDYFACTLANIRPDFLCLSKGLTGGFLPMGLTVTTSKVFEAFYSKDRKKTFFHGHSYTANPVGCAAALASLKLLKQREQVFRTMESRYQVHLDKLRSFPMISNPRSIGTVAAFDIVTTKGGYLDPIGKDLTRFALKHGVLLRPIGNVVYIFPPLCITDDELKQVFNIINEFLTISS